MRLPTRIPSSLLSLLTSIPLAVAAGCAAESGESLGVDCGGKCDGFDDIRALIRDPSELDLDDLIRVGAPYATDEINDALTLGNYAQFRLGETKAFSAADLGTLTTGLGARFGETDLSTETNRIRAGHLASSSDNVFAESTFALRSELATRFNIDTGDDEGSIRLGFGGGEIAVHMVAAYENDIEAIKDAPLATIKQTGRGFVLPRDISDIRAMKPGESIGMRAAGSLGINVGVGVPILIAEPTSFLTYNLVVSAGLRNTLEGELDVQMIRMAGNEVVIDVGMERARVKSSRLAVDDSWGVQGLLESNVNIAGVDVDLGRLVERALEKQINRRIELISARRERENIELRMSVSRLRFDLSKADAPEIEAAIAQALRGDVRLAQALANRGDAGVKAEYDLSRSGVSATAHAGIRIAGMDFFRTEIETAGNVVVQTPGGARSILFESLHRSSGWFLKRHGYTQVELAAISFDASGNAMRSGEANLIVQIDEGDKAMERDKFVDYLDSIIVGTVGTGALSALETVGNQIEDLVETTCAGTDVFDDCPIDMAQSSQVANMKSQALASFDSAISHVPADVRAVARRAAELRVLAQSVYEQKAQVTGPGVSMTVDFRLDNDALAALFAQGAGTRVTDAIEAMLTATEIDRRGAMDAQRRSVRNSIAADLEDIAVMVDDYAREYRKLANIEAASIERLGGIGARTIEVRWDVDADNRPKYEDAVAGTLAARRSDVASSLFTALREEGDGFGPHAEQLAGFALLGATPGENTDIRLDMDINTDETAFLWREPYRAAGYPNTVDVYGRGPAVSPIDAGQFEIDQLIELK